MLYLSLKAFHLICVVSWFAAMFYIFRLFVYHVQNWQKPEMRKVFEVMERKLIRFIMIPAANLSLLSGIAMLTINPSLLRQHWIWLKFAFILILLGYSGYSYRVQRQFAKGQLVLSEKACRWFNEVPTIALIGISVLVFLKPGLGQ